ncbi:MAG: hypothetical protein WD904_04845 [Dehalococcoidia bacterium]
MTDDKPAGKPTGKREDHIGDALAHAMVPPGAAEPAGPLTTEGSPLAQSEVVEDYVAAELSDPRAVYDGEVIGRLEDIFPLAWLAMLTVVCVIGIYNAVRLLP